MSTKVSTNWMNSGWSIEDMIRTSFTSMTSSSVGTVKKSVSFMTKCCLLSVCCTLNIKIFWYSRMKSTIL